MKRIYCIGIGPGDPEHMTASARSALSACDEIIGFTTYIRLIEDLISPEQRVFCNGMTNEKERCLKALQDAAGGMSVGVISSGDPGVYGMASLLYELRAVKPSYADVEIQVESGVTAATAAAAVLGAPLGHDFAVISLSDLLTPMDVIEKRLRLAAEADLVICLYNPGSRKRAEYLSQACRIVMQYQQPDTCCGFVRNIGRKGQESRILRLEDLCHVQGDMLMTVIIGNSTTRIILDKLVTPRGYRL